MLWFAKAADLDAHDSERARLNRLRALTWQRQAAVPILAVDHGAGLKTIAFQPGGNLLLSLTDIGQLRLFRWDTSEPIDLPLLRRPASSAAWSPDGKSIAVGHTDGSVELCQVRAGPSRRGSGSSDPSPPSHSAPTEDS